MRARLLNLGCGSSFHGEWINLDTVPAAPGVIRHDLKKGLPFSDGTFDAVYSSHVIEHFQPPAAQNLINECYRVLRPDGIARIVVPDLETIVRLYLSAVEGAVAGDTEAERRYDWLMLELYDQTSRTVSGGNMQAFMRGRLDEDQRRFVSSRIGSQTLDDPVAASAWHPLRWRLTKRLQRAVFVSRRATATGLAFLALGREGSSALNEGLFRRSGEVHQWMYDRFSLARLLRDGRFKDVCICRAGESGIPDFAKYGLEIVDGKERKPDSLYVEARKRGPT
jgi:predicted SAM-dependent methyltransferase